MVVYLMRSLVTGMLEQVPGATFGQRPSRGDASPVMSGVGLVNDPSAADLLGTDASGLDK
ncbi:MAG: hypothetical protein M3536_12125 [Actinomycetota bacterium]|nr:hypothetical protein [Actinomycetota bacterium]